MSNLLNQFAFSPEEAMRDRANGQKEWLLQQDGGKCFDEQLHSTEGTQERIYWHYGYMVAVQDVLNLLAKKRAEQN